MRHVNATTTSTGDAVNLRHDFATPLDITNGEWNTDGMTNHPACYTTNRLATIRARFTVTPASVTNLTIGATVSGATPILADLVATNILFSGGVSVGDAQGYVTLAFATAPITTTGPHTNFTIFAESNLPWGNTFGSPTNAWVTALDIVCSDTWAGGAKTIEDAASQITRAIYESGRFQYDTKKGDCNYTKFTAFGVDYFNLTGWIARLNGNAGNGGEVNCWDCANGVVSLSNILGCDLWNQWIGQGFYCNEIRAISNHAWGKPFWGGFGYHRIGWRGPMDDTGKVFDACLKVDTSGTPFGSGHMRVELVPTNMLFGPASNTNSYKFHLVDPMSHVNCNPRASLPMGQNPGQRRDPIK